MSLREDFFLIISRTKGQAGGSPAFLLTLTTSDEWKGKIYVESITTFLVLAQQPRLSFNVPGEAIDTSGQIVKVLTRQRSMTLDPYDILSGARDGKISISTLVGRALRKRSMPTGLESTK